jgi:hypothetical protein
MLETLLLLVKTLLWCPLRLVEVRRCLELAAEEAVLEQRCPVEMVEMATMASAPAAAVAARVAAIMHSDSLTAPMEIPEALEMVQMEMVMVGVVVAVRRKEPVRVTVEKMVIGQ